MQVTVDIAIMLLEVLLLHIAIFYIAANIARSCWLIAKYFGQTSCNFNYRAHESTQIKTLPFVWLIFVIVMNYFFCCGNVMYGGGVALIAIHIHVTSQLEEGALAYI